MFLTGQVCFLKLFLHVLEFLFHLANHRFRTGQHARLADGLEALAERHHRHCAKVSADPLQRMRCGEEPFRFPGLQGMPEGDDPLRRILEE